MATYTVKAPDGKTITLQGPDGASQSDIIAQAQTLYKPTAPVAAKPAAPAPAPAPAPARPAPNPDQASALTKYNYLRNTLSAREKTPEAQAAFRNRFDADPRAQRLRAAAGLAPLSTAQNDVQKIARQSVDQRMKQAGTDIGQGANAWQSASAGIARGMFGIPEHLAAAAERFLPSSITGNTSNASYSNILQMIRAKDDAAMGAHPAASLPAEIAANVVGGGAAGKVIGRVAGNVAARGIPVASRIAKAVEAVGTLNKGQKLKNAVKLATIGGAAGGAQAAGEGSDVGTGVATGAIAAPVLAGGFKVAQVISRPFRDVMRLSSAGQILSRLTTASQTQLEKLAATYRAQTGAEPTLFELLPLADRNKILKQAVVGKDNVVEQTSKAIRARAQNLGPEMSARARQILQPQRDFIHQGITRDMTAARGGTLHPDDPALIAKAMDSPTDMLNLRDQEAKAIMAPHETTPVGANLEDVLPHVPGPNGSRAAVDPEVATVIRNAAGLVRQRANNAGITAGDVTDMISKIRPMLGQGGNDAMVAERAINHLHDVLDTQAPDAGAAARQMRDAYAARSRMAEGMQEGAAGRLRDDVQVGTNRGRAQTVRNAYDTPEGANGRSLGQGNRILTDLAGSPEEALRATVKQSRGSTGRQLRENLGPAEGTQLSDAARAQDESAQALAAASSKAQSGSGDGADAEMLVQAIAGLHPSSFITTKAGAMRKLLDMTYIPESRARTIVDMVFSQDPGLRAKALKAIGNEPNGAAVLKSLVGVVGQESAGASMPDTSDNDTSPLPAPTAPVTTDPAPAEASPDGSDNQAQAQAVLNGGDSPYAAQLSNVYAEESPELIDLIGRVKGQEHGVDAHGNFLTSKAGAIGPMQVMPGTAPEAAALAGVPFDDKAYRSDPAYNELIGIAYLSELLRKYDGNVAKALAAYNAGPGAADHAMNQYGENFLAGLPAETQDYVSRVG